MNREKQKPIKGSKKDYTVRRKKIYKGKVAETGTIFIVVQVKNAKHTYEAHLQIKGGAKKENEDRLAEDLRKQIKKEYGI
jgi:hypothetical protein